MNQDVLLQLLKILESNKDLLWVLVIGFIILIVFLAVLVVMGVPLLIRIKGQMKVVEKWHDLIVDKYDRHLEVSEDLARKEAKKNFQEVEENLRREIKALTELHGKYEDMISAIVDEITKYSIDMIIIMTELTIGIPKNDRKSVIERVSKTYESEWTAKAIESFKKVVEKRDYFGNILSPSDRRSIAYLDIMHPYHRQKTKPVAELTTESEKDKKDKSE